MKLITLIIVALLFNGSVHAEHAVRSLLESRQENLIIQRWDNSCGAAALATMLTYYNKFPISEEQVARAMLKQTDPLRVRQRGGFSLLDMQQYLAQIGFEGDGYAEMSLDDLAGLAPMIVPLSIRSNPHFVIVVRLDPQFVHIADSSFGNYRLRHENFAKAWPGIGFQIQRPHGK